MQRSNKISRNIYRFLPLSSKSLREFVTCYCVCFDFSFLSLHISYLFFLRKLWAAGVSPPLSVGSFPGGCHWRCPAEGRCPWVHISEALLSSAMNRNTVLEGAQLHFLLWKQSFGHPSQKYPSLLLIIDCSQPVH